MDDDGKSLPRALTEGEKSRIDLIGQRLSQTAAMLSEIDIKGLEYDPRQWFKQLAALKTIVGNASNDLSFIACLLAKEYLLEKHRILHFDVAEKAQGASGLDFNLQTVEGKHIIAELKTTTPYKQHDFGAQQWTSIRRDFQKLQAQEADEKYFFVTDRRAFEVLKAAKLELFSADVKLVFLEERSLTL